MARAAKVTEAAKGKEAATKPAARTAVKDVAPPPPAVKAKKPAAKATLAAEKPTKATTGKGAAAKAAAAPAKPAKAPVVSLKQVAIGVADNGGMSRPEAHMLATKLIGSVVDQVRAGARVKLAGLGVIEIRDRPARTARNPATGEPVQVAASRKLVFRPAKELKDAL